MLQMKDAEQEVEVLRASSRTKVQEMMDLQAKLHMLQQETKERVAQRIQKNEVTVHQTRDDVLCMRETLAANKGALAKCPSTASNSPPSRIRDPVGSTPSVRGSPFTRTGLGVGF